MNLLTNQTTNTIGSQPSIKGMGGSVMVQVEGVFDGAVVGLEGSLGDLNWQPLRDTTGDIVAMTSASTVVVAYAKSGLRVRASVTLAGASTDITAVAAT